MRPTRLTVESLFACSYHIGTGLGSRRSHARPSQAHRQQLSSSDAGPWCATVGERRCECLDETLGAATRSSATAMISMSQMASGGPGRFAAAGPAGPVSALQIRDTKRRAQRVHEIQIRRISAVTTVHSVLRLLAGISCPSESVRERSRKPEPSMVRKGRRFDSVRGLQEATQNAAFSCGRSRIRGASTSTPAGPGRGVQLESRSPACRSQEASSAVDGSG